MLNEKHFLKSKTVWGALASFLSFAIIFFITKPSHAIDEYWALMGMFSSVFAIYGRITAKHKLTIKETKNARNNKESNQSSVGSNNNNQKIKENK